MDKGYLDVAGLGVCDHDWVGKHPLMGSSRRKEGRLLLH